MFIINRFNVMLDLVVAKIKKVHSNSLIVKLDILHPGIIIDLTILKNTTNDSVSIPTLITSGYISNEIVTRTHPKIPVQVKLGHEHSSNLEESANLFKKHF